MTPDQLGPYKIVHKLGRGGMGTVYEAVNVQTNEQAAVKLLNPHLADEEGFRERFEIEIETLKKLKHPNIVRLFGHGIHDGQLYYAMELVRGTNLEEELQAGRRFDWRETTRTGIRLCKALKHAHDHGVIHRDLKPANLLLTDEGEIKLTDFGIARLFGNTRLTADGGLIGTAEYMAPEQADGKQVTHHADLYSLGCVMFAMLAARPPFRGKSLPEMLQMQRLAEPPLVSRFAPDVPHELERIIVRLLSKNPSERPTNADLLARQLAAMEHGLSLPRRDSSHAEDASLEAGFSSTASERTLPDEGNPPPIEYDPNAPTRVAEPEFSEPPLRPRAIAHGKPQTIRGETGVDSGEGDESPVAIVKPLPAGNRFVTVEEEEAHQRELERRRERGPVAVQIALLSASLLTLVALAWYFLRPPSADVLYEGIEAAANDEDPDLLMESADDVESFLNRFPDDERARQVRLYQEEIELLRLERRFSRRSRQLIRDADLLPIERDYIEAINQIGIDPQRTHDELRALVFLYREANSSSSDERSRQVHTLAMRQLARLEQQARAQAPEFLEMIDRKLKQAELKAEHQAGESLGEAMVIWRSIITLYGDKPWARERVERAREELRRVEGGRSQMKEPE